MLQKGIAAVLSTLHTFLANTLTSVGSAQQSPLHVAASSGAAGTGSRCADVVGIFLAHDFDPDAADARFYDVNF